MRLLGVLTLVAAVLSLGAALHVRGAESVPLPWRAVRDLPILGQMLPSRFAVFVSLGVAMLGATWIAGRRRLAWLLPVLAIVTLSPATQRAYWHARPPLPAFFENDRWRAELRPSDTALVPPIGIAGQSMLWSRGRSRLPDGGRLHPGARGAGPVLARPAVSAAHDGATVPDAPRAAASFVARNHVTVVLLDANVAPASPWTSLLRGLGWNARTVHGVVVMRPSRG